MDYIQVSKRSVSMWTGSKSLRTVSMRNGSVCPAWHYVECVCLMGQYVDWINVSQNSV